MLMKSGSMDPKKKVLEELMAHLDEKDGSELGDAMKPKGLEVEVTKVGELGADGEEPILEEGAEVASEGAETPAMSEEELAELIEAIQSKLGA